jgi:RNA-binding protein
VITGKQRSILRAYGNELGPILMVGKGGVTDQIVAQLDLALTARELLKARVLPHTGLDAGEVAGVLSSRTGSDVVQVIGSNILFYRAPEKGVPSKINWTGAD